MKVRGREPLLSLLSRRSGVNLDELSAPALFIEELVGLASVVLVTGDRPMTIQGRQ